MPQTRPTPITVIGILNIVLGSLSLAGSLCNGLGVLVNSAGVKMGGGGPGGDLGGQELWQMTKAEVPGFVAFEWGSRSIPLGCFTACLYQNRWHVVAGLAAEPS